MGTPGQLVARLDVKKCEAIVSCILTPLLSGDQVMTLDDQILGKPSDKEDAFQQLSQCSGKLVTSLSNVSVLFQETVLQKQPRVALSFAH